MFSGEGSSCPAGRAAAHKVFAAIIAVLPEFEASLLSVHGFGSAARISVPWGADGRPALAYVNVLVDDGRSRVEVTCPDGARDFAAPFLAAVAGRLGLAAGDVLCGAS